LIITASQPAARGSASRRALAILDEGWLRPAARYLGRFAQSSILFFVSFASFFFQKCLFSSEVEHRICNATAVGSIPTKGYSTFLK